MSRPRQKLRTRDYIPKPQQRFVLFEDSKTSDIGKGYLRNRLPIPPFDPAKAEINRELEAEHRRDVRDAKMSSYLRGKGHITYIANNGTPHPWEVCSDANLQEREAHRARVNHQARQYWRKRGLL